MIREFTGRHMAMIMVAFFGVVIAVNLFMARQASATFGGLVVENSYVASQHFNRWLDEADRGHALGWQASATRTGTGQVRLTLGGLPAGPVRISAQARHPLGRLPDRTLAFVPGGPGQFQSTTLLPSGRWRLRLTVEAGGHIWRSEAELP